MLCPLCHGHRLLFYHGQLLPCPECEGHGEIHCCDGLQEQPSDEPPAETEADETPEPPSEE